MDGDTSSLVSYPYPFNVLSDHVNTVLARIMKLSVLLVMISNIFWIAVAFHYTKLYSETHKNDLKHFIFGTLVISLLYSCTSFTEIFQEDVMSPLRMLFEILQSSVAVPFLTTETWLKYGVAQNEIAYVHIAIGLIPTYIYLLQHYTRRDLIDFSVVVNIISLISVGLMHHNIYTIICSICVFLLYYAFYDFSIESTSKQFYNYIMAVFTYCAYMSVL